MQRTIIVVTTLLLAVSVYLANLGFWMQSEITDAEAFNATAIESFALPGSYEALGEIVADKVVEEYPALTFVRSNLASLMASILATEPLEPALIVVAEDVHDRLFGGTGTAVVIDLADYEDVIIEGLDASAPGLVSLLPSDLFRQYTLFDAGEIPDLAAEADRIRTITMISLASAVAAIVLLAVVGRRWTESAMAVGIALMLASVVTFVVRPLATGVMRVSVTDADYRKAVVHRQAAVETSRLIRLVPGKSGEEDGFA